MKRQALRIAVLLVAALIVSVTAHAQTSSGAIAGSIRDPQGGVLPA